MSAQWGSFFMMVGGGAAVLTGLVFVVISMNYQIIFENALLINRAIKIVTGFTGIFMASGLALIGNQCLNALGFEWLVLWLLTTVIAIKGYLITSRSRVNSIGVNLLLLAGVTVCYFTQIISAIFLILGYRSGLIIAAVAIFILLAFLISGAWLLMTGIYKGLAHR